METKFEIKTGKSDVERSKATIADQTAMPSPATHAILTLLKAGFCLLLLAFPLDCGRSELEGGIVYQTSGKYV